MVLILMSLAFVSCQNKREWTEEETKNWVDWCTSNIKLVNNEAYCNCAVEKVKVKFSPKKAENISMDDLEEVASDCYNNIEKPGK